MLEPFLRHRQTHEPAPKLRHEIDGLRRDLLGGKRKVAFVLAVLVVDDDDHASRTNLFNRVWNVCKRGLGAHSVPILAVLEGRWSLVGGRLPGQVATNGLTACEKGCIGQWQLHTVEDRRVSS